MTVQTLGARSICLKCSTEIIYNNVGVTTSIGSPPVMAWTTPSHLQDDTCRAGGKHSPADNSPGGGGHMILIHACGCCERSVPTPYNFSNADKNAGNPPSVCQECHDLGCGDPNEPCNYLHFNGGDNRPDPNQGGHMPRLLEHQDLETLLVAGARAAENNDLEGGKLVGEELIARGYVNPITGDVTPEGEAAMNALENGGTTVPNPETTRRIEVIDMALSFGADPETSMPLTDDKRRLLEQEKALLQGGSTVEEATEATTLDADVAAMLTTSFQAPVAQPEPEVVQTPVVNDEPLSTQEADMIEQFHTPAQVVQPDPMNPTYDPNPPANPPAAPVTPPAPTPEPSLGDTVKAAVSEALGALLNGGGGGGSSTLDEVLAKIDVRDSESALKLFTWLWENHRFQVIGQLNGGGYMLHYAEPKGTTQAGYMPGGTKGGRMVDEALQRAKDNPAAAKHGMCPQCMSAVKQNIETGAVVSDDEKNDPTCPAGGNHAFAG